MNHRNRQVKRSDAAGTMMLKSTVLDNRSGSLQRDISAMHTGVWTLSAEDCGTGEAQVG